MTRPSHPMYWKQTQTLAVPLSHRETQSFVIIALGDFIPLQIVHVRNLSRKTSVLNDPEWFHQQEPDLVLLHSEKCLYDIIYTGLCRTRHLDKPSVFKKPKLKSVTESHRLNHVTSLNSRAWRLAGKHPSVVCLSSTLFTAILMRTSIHSSFHTDLKMSSQCRFYTAGNSVLTEKENTVSDVLRRDISSASHFTVLLSLRPTSIYTALTH